MRGLEIRPLRTPEEFALTQDVARSAWGFSDLNLPAPSDMIAGTHAGGLTAGAFLGRKLAGFAYAIPRTNLGEPCHHSHLLAVRKEMQGRDLGARLKHFQRLWCLEHGIRLMTWTYDPLLVKNARLNLVRLRAAAWRYLPGFYGPMGGIYGDLPTDRFEVRWRLEDPLVEAAAAGQPHPEPDLAGIRVFRGGRVPPDSRLVVEIPLGAPALYAEDPAAARRSRLALRRRAMALFAAGYEANALVTREDRGLYLFERA